MEENEQTSSKVSRRGELTKKENYVEIMNNAHNFFFAVPSLFLQPNLPP
jgi:hypothetical protein